MSCTRYRAMVAGAVGTLAGLLCCPWTAAAAAAAPPAAAAALADVPLPPGVRDGWKEFASQLSLGRIPFNMSGMESNGDPAFRPGLGDVDYSSPPLPRRGKGAVWIPIAQRDMHAEFVAFYRQRLKAPEWQESSGTIQFVRGNEVRQVPWTRFQKTGATRAVRVLIRSSAIEIVEYLPALPKGAAPPPSSAPPTRPRPRPSTPGR